MLRRSLLSIITLVLPRGVVTTPLTVYLRPHKNAKENDPGYLGHLFYILCGHFDEKNRGYPPKMGVGWAVKVRRWGWLPPQNNLSRHFQKYLHGMVLKLSEHVRNTISLLYKQKPGEIPIFGTFLAKKWIFFSIWIYFHWKSAFWVRPCLKTSLWRHTLTDFHDFGINGKRKPYPIPWYKKYFGLVNFKFMKGW